MACLIRKHLSAKSPHPDHPDRVRYVFSFRGGHHMEVWSPPKLDGSPYKWEIHFLRGESFPKILGPFGGRICKETSEVNAIVKMAFHYFER